MYTKLRSFFYLSLLANAFQLQAQEPIITRLPGSVLTITFGGTLSEHKLPINKIDASFPSDWTAYTHLVMEIRTSSPQRFSLWVYRNDGTPIRILLQPFGQNVWLRASIPLQYLKGMDQSGTDLASTNNRRTNSFWMSVWGPFGEMRSVESIGFAMTYPINKPTLEIRAIHLTTKDEGSDFLEKLPVLTPFNQWAHGDWPGKIRSREQLNKELSAEEKKFGSNADFGYCGYGGYKKTKAAATGFFRVEQINEKWWFIDPDGHYFLSTGTNGTAGRRNPSQAAPGQPVDVKIKKRLESWGMTTGGEGRATTVMLRWKTIPATTFLGMPDVYSEEFAHNIDSSANVQCTPLINDPYVLGYFIGNEPPWDGRESEVADMILKGPVTATQGQLRTFLSQHDNLKRRKEFMITAFEKYLEIVCTAVKKYDPNHLNLGIRFGGPPSDEMLRTGKIFDVCSVNVYEYEPTKIIDKVYRLTGRPILIGEFHIGVPANGLGAGLVQAKDQTERGIGYRYYVEQAASLNSFLGAHWFTWRDEPVLGRNDGENYNIGFVDVTNRPYKELVEAAKKTNRRLFDVHSGKVLPFNIRPKASEAGTPLTPWGY
jgi:hypothetical protein